MTINEQFSAIIQENKQEELIPFLKTLQPADKKVLSPLIKKMAKHYWQFGNISGNSYGYVNGTNQQRHLLQTAAFVCHNRVDFEKSPVPHHFIRESKLKHILPWYMPDWFSDFLNKAAGLDHFTVNYSWLTRLVEMGAYRPTPELVVKSVENMIFENQGNTWSYVPENLWKGPLTLQEHIWYLFDYETNIHYSDRFLYFGKDVSKENKNWQYAFKTLVQEGRLDRQRVLKEALLASNKNFNKVLSGWFADLFLSLEPTQQELIALQKELVTVLNAPQSKPVSVALQCLKTIIEEKDTDVQAVLNAMPVVLAGSTKNLLNIALALMEQVAKKRMQYHTLITQLCCQLFIHQDEAIQIKAARVIDKYGDKQDENIKTQLAAYSDNMLQSSRKILIELLRPTQGEKSTPVISPRTEKTGLTATLSDPIPPVDTIDDLLFLAAQAFDNNASWHFDILPAALVRMQTELKGPALAQLQPALQRAVKVSKGGLRSTQGFYDHMLSIFFIDVCLHLLRKHPADATSLQKVFDSFDVKTGDKIEKWIAIPEGESYISHWSNEHNDPYYLPFKQLLIEALAKIWRGDSLPLLSTPTHQPGGIAPGILIERLAQYQQRSAAIETMDMQLAIARCALADNKDAIALAKQKLTGEWQELMLFLLEPAGLPQPPFTQTGAWMMASLSKHPKKKYEAFDNFGSYKNSFEKYTGQFGWSVNIEELDFRKYAAELGTSIEHTTSYKLLSIDLPPGDGISEDDPFWLHRRKKKKSKSVPVAEDGPLLLYDFFSIKSPYLTHEPNDIRRALLMAPNNIEVFLSKVLNHCLGGQAYTGEGDKKMVIAVLPLLHELWGHPGEMAHLFVATCMLSADKATSGMAAEIWLRYAPLEEIDNALIGSILGKHEKIEFAPLKRLTDLMVQSLFRVSPQHNRMLQVIIESMLVQLPDEPIKGLKKLLEILAELSALNKQPVETPGLEEKLAVWKEVDGLRTVVRGLQA